MVSEKIKAVMAAKGIKAFRIWVSKEKIGELREVDGVRCFATDVCAGAIIGYYDSKGKQVLVEVEL